MLPLLDENETSHLVWKDQSNKTPQEKWPIGPVRWKEREDGDLDMVAMGSVNGKERRDIIATLKVGEARAAAEAAVPAESSPAAHGTGESQAETGVGEIEEKTKTLALNGVAIAPVATAEHEAKPPIVDAVVDVAQAEAVQVQLPQQAVGEKAELVKGQA